ncbi:hypothetical protein ATANTOWER_015478, partial [Ataeniobius toweri]|nr:hypothetical protein [Ataeniobius toweri]
EKISDGSCLRHMGPNGDYCLNGLGLRCESPHPPTLRQEGKPVYFLPFFIERKCKNKHQRQRAHVWTPLFFGVSFVAKSNQLQSLGEVRGDPHCHYEVHQGSDPAAVDGINHTR